MEILLEKIAWWLADKKGKLPPTNSEGFFQMGGRGEGGNFRSKRLAFCWELNPWKKSKNSSEFVSGGFPKCVVDRLEALQVWACLVKLYCLAC